MLSIHSDEAMSQWAPIPETLGCSIVCVAAKKDYHFF